MRILGVDCGTERTGYGIVESDGRDHRLIAAGVVKTKPSDPLASRLRTIAEGLREVIRQHEPEMAAVEAVFHAVNVKTALKLAHARGVALLSIAEAGLDCAEYSPLEIKRSVVGYGRAEKSQVKMMVASLLGLAEPIASEDASDALAVAICHAAETAMRRRLNQGGSS
jgi:crossover junction endodeoxyribonuclease RuvC